MTSRHRVWAYLTSRRNIVGMVLAIGGLGLFATGLVGGLLGVGVIVALYAIGVLVVPPEQTMSISLESGHDAGNVRDALASLVKSIQGRVAPDILAKVVSIQGSILTTLANDRELEAADPNVYLIQQTALTYLPQALSSYLAVPRPIAERRPIADGRTPHDVLFEQLDLMDRKLVEVADDLARHDTDRLLVNGRFLADRFGGSTLKVGADVPAGSTASQPDPATERTTERDRERVH